MVRYFKNYIRNLRAEREYLRKAKFGRETSPKLSSDLIGENEIAAHWVCSSQGPACWHAEIALQAQAENRWGSASGLGLESAEGMEVPLWAGGLECIVTMSKKMQENDPQGWLELQRCGEVTHRGSWLGQSSALCSQTDTSHWLRKSWKQEIPFFLLGPSKGPYSESWTSCPL